MESEEWVTGTVKLKLLGEPVEMEMTVPARPVKPHRMLPIFHGMTNAFVDQSVEVAEAAGGTISCKAGCGACCRQPVPVAESEIYQIAELVEAMPEPRRTAVKQRFANAVEHFAGIGWFDEAKERSDRMTTESREEANRKMVQLAMKYFHEGVPCPFLENESCSIHESRPLSCREYLVTSPAENCAKPSAETVRVITIFVKASLSVRRTTQTGNLNVLGFVPLIRSLEVAEKFPERFEEKTGREWMAEFFEDLTSHNKGGGEQEAGVA